jgi:hypothetical protein
MVIMITQVLILVLTPDPILVLTPDLTPDLTLDLILATMAIIAALVTTAIMDAVAAERDVVVASVWVTSACTVMVAPRTRPSSRCRSARAT